jgi:endonuclease YncB( thermonuclease family)
VRTLIAALVFASASVGPSWAAEAIVTDGDTIVLNGVSHQLEGIDAPDTDQLCLDAAGAVWRCGIEARDQLKKFIGNRDVRCEAKKFDHVFRNRRIGICRIEGEAMSLNRWLVREGWALSFAPLARARFKADEDDARSNVRGLWKGCFARPQSARRPNNSGQPIFLGAACPKDRSREVRNILFPTRPTMQPGCSIKARLAVRANLTGHRGIYHLESCRSYRRTTNPDRWFCSEDEARAEGFRKSLTC